jgi:hypothetical protein
MGYGLQAEAWVRRRVCIGPLLGLRRLMTDAFPANDFEFASCFRRLILAFIRLLKMGIQTWGKCHE